MFCFFDFRVLFLIYNFKLKQGNGLIIPKGFAHGYSCLHKENIVIKDTHLIKKSGGKSDYLDKKNIIYHYQDLASLYKL